jgi:glycosyltransferase involved in cell wall biosynthesis
MGEVPVTIVMITLNEAHTIEGALRNVAGWARRVIIVDSYSRDATVDIALRFGAQIVQRRFTGFGDQWNFALSLATETPWTMKMDPDERISDRLKRLIAQRLVAAEEAGFTVNWHLWFMGKPIPVSSPVLRLWRTGRCTFTGAKVNEHPLVNGSVGHLDADLEHHDSPSLDHWLYKQNAYTSAEARAIFAQYDPGALGAMTRRQQLMRLWFRRIPMRYQLYFLYCFLGRGAWRAGHTGWIWAHLRTEAKRLVEYKVFEMTSRGSGRIETAYGVGRPDDRVPQH